MKNKGQTGGLSIFLSVIVFIFIIGIFVYLFALMGSELKDTTYTSTEGAGRTNETVNIVAATSAGTALVGNNNRNAVCTIMHVTNHSATVTSGNYSVSGCLIRNLTNYWQVWNVTYNYTYDADNEATTVMNDSINGVSDAIDWLPLMVVIAAMIAVILLVVMIIVAIRGSGLMEGNKTGTSNIGTA